MNLCVFDLETTSADVKEARIVEIGIIKLKYWDDEKPEAFQKLVNPGIAIPREASEVHGIKNEDVREKPLFGYVAKEIMDFIGDADIAGFNVEKYDIPILKKEMDCAGYDSRCFFEHRRIIDAMTIFHRHVQRDLSSAALFYLREPHDGAHRALDDAVVTAKVLAEQVKMHQLPGKDLAELEAYCHAKDPSFVDQEGKIQWRQGVATFCFGKLNGVTLKEAVEQRPDYLQWILKADFPSDLKQVLRDALDGRFPVREAI